MQLVLLLNTNLLYSIQLALDHDHHKLMDWIKSRDAVIVEYSDCAQFANLNTLHDLDPLS